MTRVLLVGYDPEAVDFSNPALPPGMTVEKIRAGVAVALKQMKEQGWEGDVCYIRPDGTAGQMVERHLAPANYACIVVGSEQRGKLGTAVTGIKGQCCGPNALIAVVWGSHHASSPAP